MLIQVAETFLYENSRRLYWAFANPEVFRRDMERCYGREFADVNVNYILDVDFRYFDFLNTEEGERRFIEWMKNGCSFSFVLGNRRKPDELDSLEKL